MEKKFILNNILLIILFISNIFIKQKYLYYLLIYLCLLCYNIYAFYIFIKLYWGTKQYYIKKLVLTSILIYIFTYFFIYDPNPFFYLFTYYFFFPDFIKAVVIILIHTYFISKLAKEEEQKIIKKYKHSYAYSPLSTDENGTNNKLDELQKQRNTPNNYNIIKYYFLSNYIEYLKKDQIMFFMYLSIIFFVIIIDINIFSEECIMGLF